MIRFAFENVPLSRSTLQKERRDSDHKRHRRSNSQRHFRGIKYRGGSYVLHLNPSEQDLFPESGIRKRDLLAYYFRTGHLMLAISQRPPVSFAALSQWNPEKAFFQKEAPDSIPEWIDRAISLRGTRRRMPYVMAQQSCVAVVLHESRMHRSQSLVEPLGIAGLSGLCVLRSGSHTGNSLFGTVLNCAQDP